MELENDFFPPFYPDASSFLPLNKDHNFFFPILIQLHKGIKKSGIMGFCDPCPGEPSQLLVEYTFKGKNYKVLVLLYLVIHIGIILLY